MFTEKTENAIIQMASAAIYDIAFSPGISGDSKAAELAEAIIPAMEISYPAAIAEIRALYPIHGRFVVYAEMAKLCNY